MWKEARAGDGRVYYYNTDTQETRWTKPDDATASTPSAAPATPQHDPAAVDASWREANAADGRTYYYNALTRETKWEAPPAFLQHQQRGPAGPDFVAGSGGSRSGPNGHAPPERRMERRDVALPQKPAFDDRRGGASPWQEPRHDNAGWRGPMATRTDEPVYATFEQAEDAFLKLLRKHNIAWNADWDDALREVIREREFRALKDPLERKEAFEKYCVETRVQEKAKEKERRAKLREDFSKMLATHEDIKPYTRWKTARASIEREAVFKQAADDDERRQMFDEYIAELKTSHAKELAHKTKTAREALQTLLATRIADPDLAWSEVKDRIMIGEPFTTDDTFEPLTELDVIDEAKKHMQNLTAIANRKLQREKALKLRRDRHAREGFRQLLQEKLAERQINAFTQWKEFHSLIKDEQRYLDVVDTAGSSPIDMLFDIVIQEDNALRSKSNDALDVLEDKRFEMDLDTKLSEFADVLRSDSRTAKYGEEEHRLIFRRLMDKVAKRAEEEKLAEQRQERKGIELLRTAIKRLEPPVRLSDSYDDVAARLADNIDFKALSADGRKLAFEKHQRRLQEREDEHERERARRDRDRGGERDRERDRNRDRDRDRDYRNGSRRGHERERERDRRHRTRSPEIDAYEADRRRAQAERERQYRKPSFGFTPPPRDRRAAAVAPDDDARDGRPVPRRRPVDDGAAASAAGSHYDRERREREMERERSYVSRADPRDRGRVLDYGDEDAGTGSSRPGSARKRRDSEASMASRRDAKRPRRTRSPQPKPDEDAPQLQSGSEEGEIEEV